MPEATAPRLALPRRRGLSLTPLIDVIFLLLMFFMLASNFSRQAELEVFTSTASGSSTLPPPLFLQLGPTSLSLNGAPLALADLPAALPATAAPALVSLRDGVEAQRLVDLLLVLRAAGHPVQVLE